LAFPGKVAVRDDRIANADSGHHRLLVGRLEEDGSRMRVERAIGSGVPGFANGDTPAFRYPQGLAFGGDDTLYVADTGNHSIRAVSLTNGSVRTLAGTGVQLRTARDRDDGAMSSPWDLALVDDTLYIAMAGIHQLWTLDVPSETAA